MLIDFKELYFDILSRIVFLQVWLYLFMSSPLLSTATETSYSVKSSHDCLFRIWRQFILKPHLYLFGFSWPSITARLPHCISRNQALQATHASRSRHLPSSKLTIEVIARILLISIVSILIVPLFIWYAFAWPVEFCRWSPSVCASQSLLVFCQLLP